jgi:hypothetical protein
MNSVLIPLWPIAFGLIVYLAPQAIIRRFSGSRRRKLTARKIDEFKNATISMRNSNDGCERRTAWCREAVLSSGSILCMSFESAQLTLY